MLSKKLLLVTLIICMVVALPVSEATMTCDTVYGCLQPCLNYVLYGGSVPTDCCNEIESLLASATTTADRQSACSCVKSLTSYASDEQLSRAASIPGQCGASVPFEISPNVDCSKVQERKGALVTTY
ncbi:putative non-specific lipid-transfer protein 5-like isoform 2 [Capsicum annuum]|nr:putative non-specific lipid-transfer protein 5-like isoform 2 [Capsicum annuum]KAF3632640.1 putative non-specific lipid-transfer protein 5-like isoform 2 [Capsicum annuum]